MQQQHVKNVLGPLCVRLDQALQGRHNYSNKRHIIYRIGGSVVEFSPATREARVRFPANADFIFPTIDFHLLGRNGISWIVRVPVNWRDDWELFYPSFVTSTIDVLDLRRWYFHPVCLSVCLRTGNLKKLWMDSDKDWDATRSLNILTGSWLAVSPPADAKASIMKRFYPSWTTSKSDITSFLGDISRGTACNVQFQTIASPVGVAFCW